MGRMPAIPAPRSQRCRWVDAAGPRAGPRPDPPGGGGPATDPWGLGCHQDQDQCRWLRGNPAQPDGWWFARTQLEQTSGLMPGHWME